MSARAIVIGAGVDAAVCAQLLARNGFATCQISEHPPLAFAGADEGWVPPPVARALGLAPGDVAVESDAPWASAPLPDGERLTLCRDPVRTLAAIRRFSERDAAAWPRFCERMATLAGVLAALYSQPAPAPLSDAPGDLWQLLRHALRLRGLGRQGLEDLLRLAPMPVADWLDDWFENDALKGLLAAAGIRHLCQGPRSAGTAFLLLHHHVGSPAGVFRPPRNRLRERVLAMPGIERREGVAVAHVEVAADGVRAVVLADGTQLPADVVVSAAGVRRSLLRLIDPVWLEPELAHAIAHTRSRGASARLTLSLERTPAEPVTTIAPSLDYLERAYDHAKHGRVSAAPHVEAIASAGREGTRLDLHVQFAPWRLAHGEWDDAARDALASAALAALETHSPGWVGAVGERRVLTPRDLATTHGFEEGQVADLDLGLDQVLWMRPLPALARQRTPIAGYYLCGPGTHPGAPVAGASGLFAAQAVLADRRR